MNVSPVSVAVIDKKTITKAEVLRAGKDGKAVKIQAVANGKYLLTQGNDGVAPENITVKRVGKSLLVMLEGSDANNPDMIIEDFFAKSGTLVGKAEDGEMHEYVATDGNADHETATLADGETVALALGEGTVDTDGGLALATGFEWSPALIALGGLAAIAAAAGLGYVVAKDQYEDSNSSQKSNSGGNGGGDGGNGGGDGGNGGGSKDVHVPVVNGMIDNVGSVIGPIAKGGRTDDTTPTLNGTGTAGNKIEVFDGATKIGETTVGADGSWSFTPEKALGAGSHSITTREKNAGGIVSDPSEAWGFVVDLTAPAKGSIGGLIDDSVNPPKEIVPGGITKDTTPVLSGKGEVGGTVEIWKDGKLQGTTKVDSEGNWKYTVPELADGKHEFSAVVVDAVGNKSLPSDPWTVEIDTVAPENKGIGQITDSAGNLVDNGTDSEDGKLTFEGEGTKGDTINIIDNGKVIGTAIVGDDGKWSFTPDEPIKNGKHEFEVIEIDPAGNESSKSDKVIIGVDNGASPDPEKEVIPDPNVPVTGSIDFVYKDNNSAGNKIPIGNGKSVNDKTLIIEGSGNEGDTVYIWLDGEKSGHTYHSIIVGADGKWSFNTPELNEEKYQFEAAFQSADGTVTAKTPIYSVKVDVTPPPKPEPEFGFLSENSELELTDLLSAGNDLLFHDKSASTLKLNALNAIKLDEIELSGNDGFIAAGVQASAISSVNSSHDMHELLDNTTHI